MVTPDIFADPACPSCAVATAPLRRARPLALGHRVIKRIARKAHP